jgi:serine/threonine protein phosphatase PrpC
MSEFESPAPFREDMEIVNSFRQIGRAAISIAEGPVEIKIGQTSIFVLDPRRDLSEDYQIDPSLANADCVVATLDSLLRTRSSNSAQKMIPLNWSGAHVVLGREKDPLNSLMKDDFISRYHLLIDRSPHGVTVHDLGSVNGTRIRNLRIRTEGWSNPTYYDANGTITQEAKNTSESYNPQVQSSIASDRHPGSNEDAAFTDEANDTIGVLDGVGSSHESGKASQLAANYIKRALAEIPVMNISKGFARIVMGEVLQEAHRKVCKLTPGSKTTAAVAKIFRDNYDAPYAVVAYAGDSRAYLLRDGKLESLTLDHAFTGSENESRARDLQDTLSDATSLEALSDEERAVFKERNIITSCLGQAGTPTISFGQVDLRPEDILILMSDGVHDNLATTEMQDVAANVSFAKLADEMVANAQQRSRAEHFRSKADDITAAALMYVG